MPNRVEVETKKMVWETPSVTPLDEAVWEAWRAKGAARDRRSNSASALALKCVLVAVLLVTAVLWARLTPYEVVVRFIITAGAMLLVAQAVRTRSYALASVYAALALFYNPVAPLFSFDVDWHRGLVLASTLPIVASFGWRRKNQALTVASFLLLVAAPANSNAGDLSRYRDFQFGTDLGTVAKQAGRAASDATVIHRRPALIQELTWRPQPLGWSTKTESAQDVLFGFYDGELYRIVVDYDRNETEGLTAADIVEAISTTYGMAAPLPEMSQAAQDPYSGDPVAVLARWQDAHYRFELIRSSYGTSYRLIGVQTQLESAAHSAIRAAKQLDAKEAPQRDAAKKAAEMEAENAKLEKARLANKSKFRP